MRTSVLLLLALLPAAPFACKADGAGVDGGGEQPPPDEVYSTFDLGGADWVGTSVPFNPHHRELELTLAFHPYAEANNTVELTHYSFPSPIPPGETVEYHELIDTYDLFFYADGRLVLDTVVEYYTGGGVFVSERVFKDLRMSADRTRLEGTEAIEVYENGWLTILYQGWLTLDRQP
jgi:hypothetical protein